jgi:hypothetical protein
VRQVVEMLTRREDSNRVFFPNEMEELRWVCLFVSWVGVGMGWVGAERERRGVVSVGVGVCFVVVVVGGGVCGVVLGDRLWMGRLIRSTLGSVGACAAAHLSCMACTPQPYNPLSPPTHTLLV